MCRFASRVPLKERKTVLATQKYVTLSVVEESPGRVPFVMGAIAVSCRRSKKNDVMGS